MRLKFTGEGRYVDGDQYRHASINVESGGVFDVSNEKALELLKSPDFVAVDPVPELPRDPEPPKQASKPKSEPK